MLDAVETATSKWTRQKKSEERHPGKIRYRASRMTREPRTTQKEAAWEVMEAAYMAASGNGTLPALARQIYYQARPKIMALTDDKELAIRIFLANPAARLHRRARRRLECRLRRARSFRGAAHQSAHRLRDDRGRQLSARDEGAGSSPGRICRRECRHHRPIRKYQRQCCSAKRKGFNPLFKAVNLANRYDLMIISTKGVSVTAARRLIDDVCGDNDLPLFVLHDFDVAGFMILGTLQRDTRRYQFSSAIEVIDLGLRLDDIAGLEREPAAATKTSADILREQLAENGATDAEIAILLNERVELNAMTSDALIAMIERKLKDYGLKKVIPDDDLLGEAYRAFHRSKELREKFEEMEEEFKESKIKVPKNLKEQVRAVLEKHPDLRWDDAIQIVLDKTQLDRCAGREAKGQKEIR